MVSSERVAADHQKATESDIWPYLHRQYNKNCTLSRGWFKGEHLVGANAVEMEHFHCYVDLVNYEDIYVL